MAETALATLALAARKDLRDEIMNRREGKWTKWFAEKVTETLAKPDVEVFPSDVAEGYRHYEKQNGDYGIYTITDSVGLAHPIEFRYGTVLIGQSMDGQNWAVTAYWEEVLGEIFIKDKDHFWII